MKKKVEKQSVKNRRLGVESAAMIGFGVIMLVLVIVCNSRTQQKLEDKTNIIGAAIQLRSGSQYLTTEVRTYAVTGEEEHYDNYWNEVNVAKNRDIAIETMKRIGITDEEEALIDAIGEKSNSLIPLEESAMEAVQGGDLQTAVDYVYGQEYQEGIDMIADQTQVFIDGLSARIEAEGKTMMIFTAVLEGIAFAVLLLAVYNQRRYFTFARTDLIRPLQKIEEQMRLISEGKLGEEFELQADESEMGSLVGSIISTKEYLHAVIRDISRVMEMLSEGNVNFSITEDYIGEFEEIRTSAELILENLNMVFSRIREATEQVGISAEQMALAVQDLADGNMEQAEAVESLTQNMEDVNERIRLTAEQAERSMEISGKAGEHLEEATRKMADLSEAMATIRECSEKINGITATINGIASQTNLLALNAAIEAARAGEAGKGFAVVAEEVKELAGSSSNSVKETDELVQQTMSAVERALGLSDETLETLKEVGRLAGESIEGMARVAEATQAQSRQVEAATDNIVRISAKIQSNSAAAEETAAAGEEQSNQSKKLNKLLEQFQLR